MGLELWEVDPIGVDFEMWDVGGGQGDGDCFLGNEPEGLDCVFSQFCLLEVSCAGPPFSLLDKSALGRKC